MVGLGQCHGHRSEVVHDMHKTYGTTCIAGPYHLQLLTPSRSFVRLAPNHVSIAEPDALPIVYAHGNGALKSEFYDAFVSIERGVFNTRDRVDHARKRKIVSHVFSQKSVSEFEPHIRHYVSILLNQWDQMHDSALKGASGPEGESGWRGGNERLWLDCLPWANYLAFDIVDSAPVPKSQKAVMDSYGKDATSDADVQYIPAVKILNGRGEYSMSMGVLPWYWRPLARKLPWYSKGQKDVQTLAGIAIMAVAKRLATPTDRNDLLSKLQAGKDEDGNPMGRAELTAEALTLLIAGSDTTSKYVNICPSRPHLAIIYHIAANPHVQDKLHKELDEQLGTEDELVSNSDQVKRLPYLDAVINEALRIHSTSALGLPRLVPEGGLTSRPVLP
ncbi:cytochrome P450 monooxygenase [Salix suchowensis]|nr:cytochrome P450 monooxygenase [Salix suchowensis]